MRSLWGKAPFQFQLRELPTPEPGPDEVVVKVAACSICGTDLIDQMSPWGAISHRTPLPLYLPWP